MGPKYPRVRRYVSTIVPCADCERPHIANAASALLDFCVGGECATGRSAGNTTAGEGGLSHNPYLCSAWISSCWVHPPAWQQNSVCPALSTTEKALSYPQHGQQPANPSPHELRPSFSAIRAALVMTESFSRGGIGC